MKAITLVLLLAACKGEETSPTWSGIPNEVAVTCRWDRDYKIGVCVGAGKAYSCVHVEIHEGGKWENPWRNHHECARTSAPVLPEEPKSED